MRKRAKVIIFLFAVLSAVASCVSDYEEGADWTADDYVERAQIFYHTNKLRSAMSQFRAALELDPEHVGANIGIAYAYHEVAKWALAADDIALANKLDNEAINHLDKVILLAPEEFNGYLGKAMVLCDRRMFKETLPVAKTASSVRPDDPRPYFYLAVSYSQLQQLAKAKEAWQNYLRTNPRDPKRDEIEDLIGEIDRQLSDTPRGEYGIPTLPGE